MFFSFISRNGTFRAQNKKKSALKKFLYSPLKNIFLKFQEMELFDRKIKLSLRTFPARKIKQNHSENNSSSLVNGTF